MVTSLEASMIAIPIGINIEPTTVKQLMTHFGVKIGCHAFSFCCLKAESDGRRDPALGPVGGGGIFFLNMRFLFLRII